MASIEQKLITAILARVRGRRSVSAPRHGHVRSDSTILAPARLREGQFSDFAAVSELKRKWGLVLDSFENWERLWCHNPALKQQQSNRPIGWVLEAAGQLVGYLGNISLSYSYGSRQLMAVVGHAFVVEPSYRAASLSLMSAFFRQKSADLFLTTTAIEAVGKMARSFKSEPLPQEDYENVLFWVLQPSAFSKAVMNRLHLKPYLAVIGHSMGSVAVNTDKILRRRWPKNSSKHSVSEIRVSEIGDDFHALWDAKLQERARLLADRSPGVLKWHFDIPGQAGATRILCCHSNGELLGYLAIRDDSSLAHSLRRSIIADALIRKDDPEIFQTLMFAAYEHAKHAGSYVLEVLGFPPNLRAMCSKWNPYHRRYPACPFYYKAADLTLHKTLSDDASWYATPFDGDTTLMP